MAAAAVLVVLAAVIPAASAALAVKGEKAWIAAASAGKADLAAMVAEEDVEGMRQVPVEQVDPAGLEAMQSTAWLVTVAVEVIVPVRAAAAVTVEMGVMS